MSSIKGTAYIFVLAGVLLQVFFDFSIFFLPSMASSEGVAVYPKVVAVMGGFMYRLTPYILFSSALWIAGKRNSRFTSWVAIASIAGTLSPIIAIGIATAINLPVGVFRERFWPIRPIVQCVSFLFALLAIAAWSHFRKTVDRAEAV